MSFRILLMVNCKVLKGDVAESLVGERDLKLKVKVCPVNQSYFAVLNLISRISMMLTKKFKRPTLQYRK